MKEKYKESAWNNRFSLRTQGEIVQHWATLEIDLINTSRTITCCKDD